VILLVLSTPLLRGMQASLGSDSDDSGWILWDPVKVPSAMVNDLLLIVGRNPPSDDNLWRELRLMLSCCRGSRWWHRFSAVAERKVNAGMRGTSWRSRVIPDSKLSALSG